MAGAAVSAPPSARGAEAHASLLQVELDKAEGVKAGGMALLIAVGILPIFVLMRTVSGFVDRVAARPGVVAAVLGLSVVMFAIEATAWWTVRRETRAGRRLSRWPGRLLVALEAMAPTLVLVLIGAFLPGEHALTAPQLLLYAVFIGPSAVRLDPGLSLLSGVLAAGSYAVVAGALLAAGRVNHPLEQDLATHAMRVLYLLMTGGAAAFVAAQLRHRFTAAMLASAERARVVHIFGRYLHDDVVDHLLHDPDGLRRGGERRTLTVMMTDLRGFSSLAEGLPPERVVALLNHYLGEMVPVVLENGGTIDEIIGDALLVIWNAPADQPDHARRGLRCAIGLQQRMAAVNAWTAAAGLPALEMGIGLHTGEAVVGNIGADQRQKYGVVGTTVNLAARVESATVGGQVLATAATLAQAGEGLQLGARRSLRPKGSAAPIEVAELLGLDGQRLPGADETLSPAPPQALRLRAVRGKELDAEAIEALLRAAGPRRLVVQLAAPQPEVDDVQIEHNGAVAYARLSPEGPDTALLRLTSAAGAAALRAAGLALPQDQLHQNIDNTL
jgi:class 3 adenylate cyclase